MAARDRGDRLGVVFFGVKGAALAALGEIVVPRTPFAATVASGLNEGESTFSRLPWENLYEPPIRRYICVESTNLFSMVPEVGFKVFWSWLKAHPSFS